MDTLEVLERFDIRVWSRNGERAPHKPLLLLMALVKLKNQGSSQIAFSDFESNFEKLVEVYGRRQTDAAYPFSRLPNDNLWQITPTLKDALDSGKKLREANAQGKFPADLESRLATDHILIDQVINTLLAKHFPETYWGDLISDIEALYPNPKSGLPDVGVPLPPDLEPPESRVAVPRAVRDPRFRAEVLNAYRSTCAICGFDGHIGFHPISIEAAHIQWHARLGPDQVPNGLALCAVHHRAFDYGAITVTTSFKIEISPLYKSDSATDSWLRPFQDHPLRLPHSPEHRPDPTYLDWHRREVFRG
ncbi:MAG: HNH endonuclease [Bdellovibrionales bacterium]|nr:HNH endonuclease [Bdellovibrionales bacterium]